MTEAIIRSQTEQATGTLIQGEVDGRIQGNRIGRLRGYGNAIVAPQAQAFIEAYLECIALP